MFYTLESHRDWKIVIPEVGVRGKITDVVWAELKPSQTRNGLVGVIRSHNHRLNNKTVLAEINDSFEGVKGQYALLCLTEHHAGYVFGFHAIILRVFHGFKDREILLKNIVLDAANMDDAEMRFRRVLRSLVQKSRFSPRVPISGHIEAVSVTPREVTHRVEAGTDASVFMPDEEQVRKPIREAQSWPNRHAYVHHTGR